MDDLMNVDWTAPAAQQTKPQPQPQPQPTSTPSFPSLNPSPLPSLSRGSTPLSTQPSGAAPNTTFRGIKAPSKPSTPANDSFSSLLASKSNKPANNLSLQERQRQLQEEKEKQRKQLESQFGAPDNAFWDSLGSGRSTPNATAGAPSPAPQPALSSLSNTINRPFAAINAPADRASPAAAQDEDDILAAFNSAAPVDASSHYPVPPAPASRGGTPSQVAGLGSNGAGAQEHGGSPFGDDDDDPFGLSQLPSRPAAQPSQPAASIDQDDDILGDLAKPVSELPPRQSEVQHKERERNGDRSDAASRNDDPRDAAVAELVDMGFPAGKQKGTEAFKRGDYAAAHTAYTSALQPLPSGHPIAIIILCNRALTNIKVGDPKAAVADADLALSTIGPSRGDGEKIAMGGAEEEKDMKDFFGKALMRKAEALENMEKWGDAAKVWKDAVEAGVGGSVSIQGRNRCEKAAGGGSQQASRPVAPRPATAAKKPAARPPPRPNVSAAASAEAVKKLREANAAAEKADDEKFALTDHVDAKLVAWKGSKSDNLRALLGSLDTVLWPEAGWKKVGMQDLVMPNKVKIVYMKAIAKVHPDKIPQSATTEQRMISGAVFATLNEAWDKFKKDNNL
ncbi:uba ts-n domain protein [Neofusicoccum parvum]|uniref:Uba ts-n domain protein n=1 Tax=Neofusicoccum parvum TaxID=310453 RepID=A0ACB5RZE0_9PEZI|nr:uba ts-n domain protein [Neofusicoccum parvum]